MTLPYFLTVFGLLFIVLLLFLPPFMLEMNKMEKVKKIAFSSPQLIEKIELVDVTCYLKIKDNKPQWMGTGLEAVRLFDELKVLKENCTTKEFIQKQTENKFM